MMHEFKKIIESSKEAKKLGLQTVLASVVDLEGSSYRRPGVRMLIWENGKFTGAVSGGCVEKEINRQAQIVFATGVPRIMTYDGRFRLGCEGILYVLIEPFSPSPFFFDTLETVLLSREPFSLHSYYKKEDSQNINYGSACLFNSNVLSLQGKELNSHKLHVFKQTMTPCNQLIIIGSEHDAVQLCSFATALGWEVTIVTSPMEEKDISHFPGAKKLIAVEPELFPIRDIDKHTAVILMTHSYAKDLKYLLALSTSYPSYLGTLGPSKRREKLLHEFMEHNPEADLDFLENIHGPAGLDIGAETPQEIAISIMAEILAVVRKKQPIKLRDKEKGIHQ
ncbi:XdhC/CoxI family protein [uncultured Maribacter sp.]|nr:XdhC/CoxI family protein [uncultured Maribacter sp.]